jgi:hypothetical protein
MAATEIGDGVTLFAHRLSTCLDTRPRYCRTLTAQAITSSEVINAAVAWTAISIFILGCVNDLGQFLGLLIRQRWLLGGGW